MPPHRAVGKGVASSNITPLGSLGPPRPFVARKPGARAVTGRGGNAGGIASPVVTPSGAPSQPAPRPVIQHVPPHRALWRGLGSSNITRQGAPACPRPFVCRPPLPARGKSGNRGALAGGYGGVTTPQGALSSPAPRPRIQHLPPHRAVWRGLVSAIVTPSGVLAPPRKVQTFPPKVTRARIGSGTVSGGVASTGITPPFVTFTTTYQRPAPYIKRPAPARATIGRGGAAGGIASSNVTPPLGAPSNPPARPVLQHLPAHRAVWRGGAVPAPLVTTSQPRPFIFRPPLPARARLGNNLTAGDGLNSTSITRQGIPAGPRPFIFRSPAPARARLGPHGTASGGAAGVTTPQGIAGPPKPFVWRSPLPARGKTGPHGTTGSGYANPAGTPLGSLGPPHPFVARKGPQRALIGHGTVAGGVPSANVTPQGTAGPATAVRCPLTGPGPGPWPVTWPHGHAARSRYHRRAAPRTANQAPCTSPRGYRPARDNSIRPCGHPDPARHRGPTTAVYLPPAAARQAARPVAWPHGHAPADGCHRRPAARPANQAPGPSPGTGRPPRPASGGHRVHERHPARGAATAP